MPSKELAFKNPAFVRARYYVGEIESLLEFRLPEGKIELSEGIFGRYRLQNEVDYAIVQFWVTSEKGKKSISLSEWTAFADSAKAPPVPKGTEELPYRDYLLSDRDLSDEVSYSDDLLYDVFYKKVGETRILYSPVEGNEFLMNFLKHLIHFDLYYSKIERFYRRFKTDVYPEVRKTHSELIVKCGEILDSKRSGWNESDSKTLSGWSLAIDELNFALQYDMESIESNLSNMKSRMRTLGAESSRYFQNHVEKAEFVMNAFDKAQDKNRLIKETILKNGIEYVAARREEQKMNNESERVHHLKNIKEIVSGLAFIEIFINGIAEAVKAFAWKGELATVLSSTAIMRMSLLTLFVFGYFLNYFFRIRKSKKR